MIRGVEADLILCVETVVDLLLRRVLGVVQWVNQSCLSSHKVTDFSAAPVQSQSHWPPHICSRSFWINVSVVFTAEGCIDSRMLASLLAFR